MKDEDIKIGDTVYIIRATSLRMPLFIDIDFGTVKEKDKHGKYTIHPRTGWLFKAYPEELYPSEAEARKILRIWFQKWSVENLVALSQMGVYE